MISAYSMSNRLFFVDFWCKYEEKTLVFKTLWHYTISSCKNNVCFQILRIIVLFAVSVQPQWKFLLSSVLSSGPKSDRLIHGICPINKEPLPYWFSDVNWRVIGRSKVVHRLSLREAKSRRHSYALLEIEDLFYRH